jgi:hypothetical protein
VLYCSVILTCEERGGATVPIYMGKGKSERRGGIWRVVEKWERFHVDWSLLFGAF